MEHGAIAIIRAARAAQLESHRAELLALIESGRPDWRDVPVCLADAWDLERKRKPAAIGEGSALEQVRRGISALDSGSHEDAALAFRDAIALDDKLDVTHHWLGVALGGLGKHAEAIAAWERALELAPDRIDTRYNIAQARYLLADFEGALREFQLVIAAEPSDVLARRKVIQCLYALGRFDDGEREREAFRNAWRASSEPRVRLVAEYVFDQFAGDGFWVLATEHLAPQNGVHALLTFRAVRRDADRSEALAASVLVETSEQARAAGTPFVLALLVDKTYKVIGAAAQLPPYARLKQDVAGMLADALRAPPA
jgi:tetratricopeptide (TPR) repeat protein